MRDEEGRLVDLIFREVNKVFARLTGFQASPGQRVREIMPNIEEYWLAYYDRVSSTGMPEIREDYSVDYDRWYRTNASRIGDAGSPLIAVVFDDITERRRAEQHQAFLLRLSDSLRSLSDVAEVQAEAARILAESVHAARVYYAEYDNPPTHVIICADYRRGDIPSLAGTHPIKSFELLEELIKGRTMAVEDTQTSPLFSNASRAQWDRFGLRSVIGVPTVRKGVMIATLIVADTAPRDWSGVTEWIEETAERTQAAVERARAEDALSVSEEKYRSLFETMSQGYAECELIRDPEGRAIDYRIITANAQFERLTGVSIDMALRHTARELVPGIPQAWIDTYERIVRTREPESFERPGGGQGRWFAIHAYPRKGDVVAVLYDDITQCKLAEEALRVSEKKYRTLFDKMDEGF